MAFLLQYSFNLVSIVSIYALFLPGILIARQKTVNTDSNDTRHRSPASRARPQRVTCLCTILITERTTPPLQQPVVSDDKHINFTVA